MQRRGHVRADLAERQIPRAAVKQVRRAMLGMRPLGHVEHRGRRLRHFLPEGGDLFVDCPEVGDALSPGCEDSRLVGGRASLLRCADREDRGMVDRRSGGCRNIRDAHAAAGEHPHGVAARHPHDDLEFRALRQIERLLELDDRDRRLMANEVPAVGLPGRVVVAVDELRHRSVLDLFLGFFAILRRWLRLDPLGLREVGRGVDQLERLPLFLTRLLHETLQFLHAPGALAAGALHEEVAVREGLELQARRTPHIGLRLEDHLLVPVTEHQNRLVGQLRGVRKQAARAHFCHLHRRPGNEPRRNPLLPGGQLLLPRGPLRAGLFFSRGELATDTVDRRQLLGRVDVGPRLIGVVQKREQAVIFVVRDRVELVRVALSALGRQPEHRLAEAVDAVKHLDHPEFLRDDRPLLVDRAIA